MSPAANGGAPAIVFESNRYGTESAYATLATLRSGASLHVRGSRLSNEIELARCDVSNYMAFRITSAEARALAVELLACADAVTNTERT